MGRGKKQPGPDSVAVAPSTSELPVDLPRSLRGLVIRHSALRSPLAYTINGIPGGQKAVFALLKLSDDPEAQAAVQAMEHPWKRGNTHGFSLEEALEKAGIAPRTFIGIVSRVAFDFKIDLGNLIASFNYPDLMRASVEKAKDVNTGTEERRMHFQHSGFIPTGKGIQILNVNREGDERESVSPGEPRPFGRTARSVVRDLPALPPHDPQ